MSKKKKSNKKKNKKKHSGNMDIALSYRADTVPAGTKRSHLILAMLNFIENAEELPDGFNVTLRWQNNPKHKWREGEFMTAISESREGFVKLVKRRLERDLKI